MSSSPVLVLDIDGVVSLAQPGSAAALVRHAEGRPRASTTTTIGARLLPRAISWRCCAAGSISTSPCRTISRPRAWPTGWRSSWPTGSTRTPSSTATCWRRPTPGASAPAAAASPATNQEHHRIAYLRDQAGLGAHFDEIVYSAALGVCKPDRVFFTNAQARMGVTVAQSILFVDDRRPTSTAPGWPAGGPCSIAGRRAWRAHWQAGADSRFRARARPC